MTVAHILVFLVEELPFRWLLIAIEVSLEPTGHSKVVHEQGVLVDVLEDAELSFVQRQFEPGLEVQMGVQSSLFVLFFG